MDKLQLYQIRSVKSASTWILFLLFGWSYGSLGKMVKQIFYYLTLGGLGLWTLYRLFTLNSAIKKYNKQLAVELGFDNNELINLGL